MVAIEGATYYQYWFSAAESNGSAAPILEIWADGDLDGDGHISGLRRRYDRVNGSYQTDLDNTLNKWCSAQVDGTDITGECIPDQRTF
jgi:hypothetical protein